ncbi:MAG TPA: zf-HC2 domain-containing protein [Streptosporangiaceae bacterium]|nr:zf-HC2 domain-containing protein [Streptosporangiaceae bacterium]
MSHLGQRLSALIDGELADTERDRVLAHLAGCDACREDAVALRALKQRMHSLGEAMVDAALTGRLMAMAAPGEGRPWAARAPWATRSPWRPRAGYPAARLLTAGILTSAMVGLGAAAFFIGGEQQSPGPKVTPAVDTFLVQHAIVTGDVPVAPVPSGAASGAAAGTTAPGIRDAGVPGSAGRGAVPTRSPSGAQAVPVAVVPAASPVPAVSPGAVPATASPGP